MYCPGGSEATFTLAALDARSRSSAAAADCGPPGVPAGRRRRARTTAATATAPIGMITRARRWRPPLNLLLLPASWRASSPLTGLMPPSMRAMISSDDSGTVTSFHLELATQIREAALQMGLHGGGLQPGHLGHLARAPAEAMNQNDGDALALGHG